MGSDADLDSVLSQIEGNRLAEFIADETGRAPASRAKMANVSCLRELMLSGAVNFAKLSESYSLRRSDLEAMCNAASLETRGFNSQLAVRLEQWLARRLAASVAPAPILRADRHASRPAGFDNSPATVDDLSETLSDMEKLNDAELRGLVFTIGGHGPDPGPAYPHQIEALRRIELGSGESPPVSGILHYPTGAGKTRVGFEIIARALKWHSDHRFIWATHTKNLIRQSMGRMAELSRLFPKETSFSWARDAEDVEELVDEVHVLFMTRDTLTKVLERAGDRRCNHPWRHHLEGGRRMTLIYDECHQLGAEKLQKSMRKFYEVAVSPPRAKAREWRTIGLSATPVPTQISAHGLLAEHVFPLRSDVPSTSHDWPFHIMHRVRNETLVKSGVLCPINLYLDQRGEFDIPAALLKKVIGDTHLRPPGGSADATLVQQYAMQFNRRVLADPRVLEFLGDRIGKNIQLLGKTIAFVPNIEAANRLAGLLYERFPLLRGKVAAVHSKMNELRVPNQEAAPVHEVLERFRRHGDSPSVLVNVDMLTEGFDDPKIKSVVLARLTLSTNRFWQMIGRGTRGPAARGTTECNVIDPVKLTRVYDYFAGYQPSFSLEEDKEFEDIEEPGAGQAALPPQVPSVVRPPDPSRGGYEVDPALDRVRAQVAMALRHFLKGAALSEQQAVDAALNVNVALHDGRAFLQPGSGAFDGVTATALLLGEISLVERRAGVDLAWFRGQLPVVVDEMLLRHRMRWLRAVESLGLWTESAFAAAQMTGALLAALQVEAKGSLPVSAGDGVHSGGQETPNPLGMTDVEVAVLDALLAIAAFGWTGGDAEINVILETMRRMYGRLPTLQMEKMVRTRQRPSALPVERLEALLAPSDRQLLLLQMAEIAACDGVVTKEERAMLDSFASRLAIAPAFVEAVLGARLQAKAPPAVATATGSCASCGFATPSEARLCHSCGTAVQAPSAHA